MRFNQFVNEMDSQGYSGSRDKKSHSKYGSRDDYELGKGKEHSAKMTTADKMMKDAHDAMMKSMSDADKVKKGWRNPNMKEQGVAEGSLNEFAPDGFNGGDDGEEFNPNLAKMAYDEGVVKGASLADGATLQRAMAINDWDKHDGGIYSQHFAKGFKKGRLDKIRHNNKQYNLNLQLMKDGSIRHGEQGVAEGSGNIGNQIKALYQKIYDQGDDAIEFMYNDSPIFAQYWDEYEGDLDSIIAEIDPKELQIIFSELQSAAEDQGITEVSTELRNRYVTRASDDYGSANFAARASKSHPGLEDYSREQEARAKKRAAGLGRALSDKRLGRETSEAYTVTRGINRERYQERLGLEGPFSTKSGKVVYYDKVEGKYYDPDTDMYIEYDDWRAMNEGGSALSQAVREAGWGRRSSYYNPMDQERREQDQMDYDKRAFKRAEMQHELGHEDDPNFERNLRQQQIDRDRGPWYLRIDGKIYRQKGQPKSFDWKRGANNYALAMIKNNPGLQGKIMLTKSPEDK